MWKSCLETQAKNEIEEDDMLVGAWDGSKVNDGAPKKWSSSVVGNILGEYDKSELDSNVPSLEGRA